MPAGPHHTMPHGHPARALVGRLAQRGAAQDHAAGSMPMVAPITLAVSELHEAD